MKPLIIGGVGGSGTRVYRAIAEKAGYNMFAFPLEGLTRGKNFHDNRFMSRAFYGRWLDRYLTGRLNPDEKRRMQRHCRMLLMLTGLFAYGRGRWGWKNPRTMYLISFFKEMYPEMCYIHVIRDGRDHAFHPKFPYIKHHRCFLNSQEIVLPDHLRKALFWSRSHAHAENDAKKHIPGRYLQSRLEDLCADPESEVKRIFEFLECDNRRKLSEAVDLVDTPSSLGRWRSQPAEKIEAVESIIGEDLLKYKYEVPGYGDYSPTKLVAQQRG